MMNKETSFMSAIDAFDKCLRNDRLSEKERIYCEAMKDFFIKFEIANANFFREIRKIKGEEEIIN